MSNTVKVTKELVDALKKLSSIHQTLKIPANTNTLVSKSGMANIVAYTKIEDAFPRDFCIYELREFIKILSIVKEPTIDLSNDDHAMIESSDGSTKIRYSDAEESYIESYVDRPFNLPSEDYLIDVSYESLGSAISASVAMKLNRVGFRADGENVYVVAYKASNGDGAISSSFSQKIGETKDTFDVIFERDHLNLVDSDCEIAMCKQKVARIKFDNHTLFVGMDADSEL